MYLKKLKQKYNFWEPKRVTEVKESILVWTLSTKKRIVEN